MKRCIRFPYHFWTFLATTATLRNWYSDFICMCVSLCWHTWKFLLHFVKPYFVHDRLWVHTDYLADVTSHTTSKFQLQQVADMDAYLRETRTALSKVASAADMADSRLTNEQWLELSVSKAPSKRGRILVEWWLMDITPTRNNIHSISPKGRYAVRTLYVHLFKICTVPEVAA